MRKAPGWPNLVKFVVSAGLLALLLYRAEWALVFDHLRELRPAPFLGAAALFVAGELVRGYRWGVLLWSLGARVPWRRLVALYFVGSFYNLVLPTGFGGDAVKAWELSRDAGAPAAISSVVVERFTGLLVLSQLAALALIGTHQLISPGIVILILSVALGSLLVAGLLLWWPRMERQGEKQRFDRLIGRVALLRHLAQSIGLYSRNALARATAAALLFSLMQILANVLLARAVGVQTAMPYFFLFVPIIAVSNMLPSLGGLGLREGAYVLLFTQVGAEHDAALSLALARDMTLLCTALIGAVIYLTQSAAGRRRG